MLAMAFHDRLVKTRKAKGLTKAAIARKLGITRQAVTMWESGKSEPTVDNSRELALVLDVNHDWLMTGRGRAGLSQLTSGLNLRGEVAAGVWLEVVENQDMEFEQVPVAPDPSYPIESQYALRVRGNSINRIAKDGSIVVCVDILTAGVNVRDGDLVVVERRRGSLIETSIKRVRKAAKGLELWPESDDPAHQEKLTYAPRKGDAEVSIKALVIWTASPVARGI